MRRSPVRLILPAALLALIALRALAPATARAQLPDDNAGPVASADTTRQPTLTNDSIIRMTRAGLEDALIVSTIRTQPGHYRTGADDAIALRQAGVSAVVIEAMQAHDSGLHSRAVDAMTEGGVPRPDGVSMRPEGVDEIGVYFRGAHGTWQMLPVERVYFRSGGWIKSTLTNNIVKQDRNGDLDGEHATRKLTPGTEFLIYAPSGIQATEYDLLRFREHSHRREFRVLTGGVFHRTSGSGRDEIEFTPTRLGPELYTFTVPADIELGEYGVLPPGANNQRGFNGTGRMFTFALVGDGTPPAKQAAQPADKAGAAK